MNNNSKVKQVIVIRKDLNMRKGKIAAQVSHASMGVLKSLMNRSVETVPLTEREKSKNQSSIELIEYKLSFYSDGFFSDWFEGKWTKICLYVETEDELLELERKCKARNIINYLVQDNGDTEFHGIPTYTCLAIGPNCSEKIDELTKKLKLL